jgi:hypothetical protein
MVSIVTDQICTLLLLDSALIGVILPRNVFVPSSSNAMDIWVNLHDLLVVASAKLRTVYANNPAIIICDALKCMSGMACLTLRAIVAPVGQEDHLTCTTSIEPQQPDKPTSS